MALGRVWLRPLLPGLGRERPIGERRRGAGRGRTWPAPGAGRYLRADSGCQGLPALLAAGGFHACPPFGASARGGGARGRPPGSPRGWERVLGSLGPAPCSDPGPSTDGARAGARRAPGVVEQPRLAPGAKRARVVNGSPLQLHLHLAAAGALRHGCTAH